MTSEEIMQVLRLTAMSRVNHPDQQVFCDKLAELFSGWVVPAEIPQVPEASVSPAATPVAEMAKRGPGRPKKAE